MPTLEQDIDIPGGTDPANVHATVQPWAAGAPAVLRKVSTGATIAGPRAVEGPGWSIANLIGNEDPDVLPAGTVYRVEEAWPGLKDPLVRYVSLPAAGGPYKVSAREVEQPATVESAALASHAADTALHGGGIQLFAAHKSDGLFTTTSTAPVPVTGWSGSTTVPDRPFEITAITSMFTGTETIPSHLAIYARVPVTAAQRVSGVVTLTVPSGHGILPGVIPLVDLANNSYDLTTDVGVAGNAITAVTATTVRYNQAGGDLGTSTGFVTFRVGITASVKGIGQAVAVALMPNVLWAPSAGLAVTFQPYVRTDNASSAANINSADLGAFGNGPNYAAMYGRTL